MPHSYNNSHPTILAIESSCDDTAASVLINNNICSNVVSSQIIHKEYGGVVPEWASRKHQLNIISVVQKAIEDADISVEDLDVLACTQGPGLLGSLLVGYTYIKGLSLALNKPFVNVDHIDAHTLAHFIDGDKPKLPFLCLLVSGGHTQIVKVTDGYGIEVLGRTRDDAAGEAFDKAGKMLGLNYPAGPEIDKLARNGDPLSHKFNTPKIDGLDFSFSGLKTSILYYLQKQKIKDADFVAKNLNDLCASIQHTIVSYLISKLEQAMQTTGINEIGIAGGVAANSGLRNELTKLAKRRNGMAYVPKFEYCTDNAAMIAFAAKFKIANKEFGTQSDVCYTRR